MLGSLFNGILILILILSVSVSVSVIHGRGSSLVFPAETIGFLGFLLLFLVLW